MTVALDRALQAVASAEYTYGKKWTPEREAQLAVLSGQKKTCSEISDWFKDDGFMVSRNAVSAKAKRIRLAGLPIEERGSPLGKGK